ncbi:MAG: hypothetical protein ACOH18_01790 [Candidatus Saccharimonadaceae bacterium]
MVANRAASIKHVRTTVLPADYFDRLSAGETATIVTDDFELGVGLAVVIPLPTTIALITATRVERAYVVTTRGYTVDQFIEIALAYANSSLDEAQRLVDELRPVERPKR